MRALVITLLSVLSLGFVIETPETVRKRELEEKKWQTELSAHYNFSELRKFLSREINSRIQVDGVVLAKARLEPEWKQVGNVRHCGDWVFLADSPTADRFTIKWVYEWIRRENDTALERSVTFYCVRKSKNEFAVDRVERADAELVFLLP